MILLVVLFVILVVMFVAILLVASSRSRASRSLQLFLFRQRGRHIEREPRILIRAATKPPPGRHISVWSYTGPEELSDSFGGTERGSRD